MSRRMKLTLAFLFVLTVALWRRRARLAPSPLPAPTWPPLGADGEAAAERAPEAALDVVADTPAATAPRLPFASTTPMRLVEPLRWIAPDVDGGCPASHPYKGNADSQIVHAPGQVAYGRTKAERCYASLDDAIADGFRPAKR